MNVTWVKYRLNHTGCDRSSFLGIPFMLFGHIIYKNSFVLPDPLMKGLDFLRHTDFTSRAVGRIPIDGDQMFAELVETKTRKVEHSKPEVHRDYLDIHFLISGQEYIGFAPDLGNNTIFENRMPEQDIIFYNDVSHETFLEMFPGSYAIFFPQDIHRPLSCKNKETLVRKVIVKIAVNTLG